jgi:hypothetical protein
MTGGKKKPESGRRVDEGQSSSRAGSAGGLENRRERSSEDSDPSLRKLAEDIATAEADPTSNTPPADPNTND